jgi:hypothetical protein
VAVIAGQKTMGGEVDESIIYSTLLMRWIVVPVRLSDLESDHCATKDYPTKCQVGMLAAMSYQGIARAVAQGSAH